MIKRLLTEGLLARVSDAFQFDAIYRPIKWRANDVLSEQRKAVRRQRYLNLALGVATVVLFGMLLYMISGIEPKPQQAAPAVQEAPKAAINAGQEAFSRGDFVKAQQMYRQVIEAGVADIEVWRNYDRALLMKTFKQVEANPELLAPAGSIRHENVGEPLPIAPEPGNNYMTDEEWEQMRQNVYNWLGC